MCMDIRVTHYVNDVMLICVYSNEALAVITVSVFLWMSRGIVCVN